MIIALVLAFGITLGDTAMWEAHGKPDEIHNGWSALGIILYLVTFYVIDILETKLK
jgi:hypothetical protein